MQSTTTYNTQITHASVAVQQADGAYRRAHTHCAAYHMASRVAIQYSLCIDEAAMPIISSTCHTCELTAAAAVEAAVTAINSAQVPLPDPTTSNTEHSQSSDIATAMQLIRSHIHTVAETATEAEQVMLSPDKSKIAIIEQKLAAARVAIVLAQLTTTISETIIVLTADFSIESPTTQIIQQVAQLKQIGARIAPIATEATLGRVHNLGQRLREIAAQLDATTSSSQSPSD